MTKKVFESSFSLFLTELSNNLMKKNGVRNLKKSTWNRSKINLHNLGVFHPMFLEHWNRQKNISVIRQCFSCLLDELIAKISKKKISRWLFEIIHIIRFEMHMDRRINLKIFLGYDINYLSIWPFMRHPWFPTRKASKLTFVCFQLAGR